MKSLAKNTFFNVVYTISNMLFPLLTSIYVSRILMADGIGTVSYAQNIASYFLIFAGLGLPTYGVREIAKVRDSQEEKNKLFTELLIINAVSTAVSVSAYLLIIFSVNDFRNELSLFLSCGLQIFFNFINIDWLYKGEEEYVYIACRSIIIKIISLIAILVFVKDQEDYINYSLISSIAMGGNYIFNVIHSKKYVKFNFRKLEIKRHLSSVIILAFSLLLSSIYSKVDITMLGSFSTKTATGLYTNAHKIIEILINVSTSITAVFLPRLSYFYHNDKTKFNLLLDLGVRIVSFIALPMSIGLFILAPQVITLLYGESFDAAVTTVRIFTILIIVKSFGDLLCYQLVICTGNEKKRLPAYAVAAIINIILNFALIPILKQNGAAIASVISELIVNIYLIIRMKSLIKMPMLSISLLQAIISTIIMAIVVWGVAHIEMPLILNTIIAVIIGIIAYFTINIVMKNEIAFMFIKKIRLYIFREK